MMCGPAARDSLPHGAHEKKGSGVLQAAGCVVALLLLVLLLLDAATLLQ